MTTKKNSQRSRKVLPSCNPYVVPLISLPYELFVTASFVTVQYELFLVVSSILAISLSPITVQYVQSQVAYVVLPGNYLFLVVPFVMVQYELFLVL